MSLKERLKLNKLLKKADNVRVYVTDNQGINGELHFEGTELRAGKILKEVRKPEYYMAQVLTNTSEGIEGINIRGGCKSIADGRMDKNVMFRGDK